MNSEKSIKEVVAEFKAAFGEVQFKATHFETGQVGGSSNWKAPKEPLFEMSSDDYLKLANPKKYMGEVNAGTIANLLSLEAKRKR